MATFTVIFASGRSETFDSAEYEISESSGVLRITTSTGVRHHTPMHWLRVDADQ